MRYHAEFGRSMSDGTSVQFGDPPEKLGFVSHFSRSLKIIGTDTDRSATYDFLLVIRSNHWLISCRFRDKRRFRSKIAYFSYPVYLTPLLTGFPLELRDGGGAVKYLGDVSIRRLKHVDNIFIRLDTIPCTHTTT